LKKAYIKYLIALISILFLWACSTRKNSFVNRNYHALTTKYNVLYNGELALEKGLAEVNATYFDNFFEVLPIERLQSANEDLQPKQAKNSNFERAETKAIKAIELHSMNIESYERNYQIDEAYLMLGKSRYYEKDYLAALEAFNYILYKYPNCNNIYQAKVWREKVNITLENETTAIKNLNKTLKDKVIKGQDFSDVNAVLAHAFVKTNQIDSAVNYLKVAKKNTKKNELKARYGFILGQLYQKLNYKDSAYVAFQEVINLNRKSPRNYTIYSHFNQAAQFDYVKGDTVLFHKNFDKLIANIENRKYLDILYHQKALFYDNKSNFKEAIKFYTKSNSRKPLDTYLTASNHRNISKIYYDKHDFHASKKYSDSLVAVLDPKHKEFKQHKKKNEYLTDVVKYQDIINNADSLITLNKMSLPEKQKYFQKYINKLISKDSLNAIKLAEQNLIELNKNGGVDNSSDSENERGFKNGNPPASGIAPPTGKDFGTNQNNTFYFYNQSTVAQGVLSFLKKWGNKELKDNWKASVNNTKGNAPESTNLPDTPPEVINLEKEARDPKYTTAFYIDQLPTDEKIYSDLLIDANYARYELGSVFKEKLRENQLAINTLEDLLANKPMSKLILPTYYNLYLLHTNLKSDKAQVYKDKILKEYPESRYASVLKNENVNENSLANQEYKDLYNEIQNGNFRKAYTDVEVLTKKYDGDELNAKFDVLKAIISGRLIGLDAYKLGLEKVVKEYPKSDEKTKAQQVLDNDIKSLEALKFGEKPKSFSLIFQTKYPNEVTYKVLIEKLTKYAKESGFREIKVSNDLYNLTDNFIVLHGLKDKTTAESILNYLQTNKDFLIKEIPIIISAEDYKVLMIKKNLDAFLTKK
jgi:tetratricopeptide (TPR) repeat protein